MLINVAKVRKFIEQKKIEKWRLSQHFFFRFSSFFSQLADNEVVRWGKIWWLGKIKWQILNKKFANLAIKFIISKQNVLVL